MLSFSFDIGVVTSHFYMEAVKPSSFSKRPSKHITSNLRIDVKR